MVTMADIWAESKCELFRRIEISTKECNMLKKKDNVKESFFFYFTFLCERCLPWNRHLRTRSTDMNFTRNILNKNIVNIKHM